MIRRPRVLMIGRRFWPHGSIDSAACLFELACALRRREVHVEVMTPRYASSWPPQFEIREIPVHRPAAAPRSDWSMGRYMRHVTAWLRENADAYDVLYVDAIREEASATIEAARGLGCSVVVRCAGWGAECDSHWWTTSRAGRRCGSIGRLADTVIVSGAAKERSLIADGFDAARITRIDLGYSSGTPRSAQSRRLARRSLASVNSDLIAQDQTPVLLCASPMTKQSGINLVARAARNLISKFPDLRIWLIGDGPYRDWIYDLIRGEGVRSSIAMPGSFSDVRDLFSAADLYVQPDENGLDYFLPAAVSAELPIVTVDHDSIREVLACAEGRSVEEQVEAMVEFLPGGTSKYVQHGVVRTLNNLEQHRNQASQLRRLLLRLRPQSNAVAAYADVFERSMRDRSGPAGRSSSVEAVS